MLAIVHSSDRLTNTTIDDKEVEEGDDASAEQFGPVGVVVNIVRVKSEGGQLKIQDITCDVFNVSLVHEDIFELQELGDVEDGGHNDQLQYRQTKECAQ